MSQPGAATTGGIIVRQLINPTDEEKAACVKIYDEAAWKHYNFLTQLAGHNKDRMHELNVGMVEPYATEGEIWVAQAPDQDHFGAVCTWCPPGVAFWETPEQRAQGFDTFEANVTDEHRKWMEEQFYPLLEVEKAVLGEDIAEHVYDAAFIATHPDSQGRGLAKALLKSMEARARKEGKKMTLMTHSWDTANRVYKKAGFEVKHVAQIKYRDGTTDPWIIMMNDCA